MKVDALLAVPLGEATDAARRAEAAGFDGVVSSEVAHDPFLPLTLAAATTAQVDLITGIAVAFARSPMTVAVTAMDVHRLSGGRLVLGIGTQIKPHVTRRFSMPWSSPARRMGEYVAALRAIWAAWQDGTALDFQGEFYSHTLMTPMFSHGPSEHGAPRVFVAAVGPALTRLAGEVADGLMAHGFTTPAYLRDITLANLQTGLDVAGRARSEVEVTVPLLTAVGRDEAELAPRLAAARHTLGFYGSTPAYRPVLEHHGWGALGDELHRLSKAGRWADMPAAIDDDVLHEFVIAGDTDTVRQEIDRRFGGLVDRLQVGIDTGPTIAPR